MIHLFSSRPVFMPLPNPQPMAYLAKIIYPNSINSVVKFMILTAPKGLITLPQWTRFRESRNSLNPFPASDKLLVTIKIHRRKNILMKEILKNEKNTKGSESQADTISSGRH